MPLRRTSVRRAEGRGTFPPTHVWYRETASTRAHFGAARGPPGRPIAFDRSGAKLSSIGER
jgi:hypothetical protein